MPLTGTPLSMMCIKARLFSPSNCRLLACPVIDPNAPHYTFDLEKSAEEFKLADLDHDGIAAGDDPEGDVWTTGFRIQMLYNQGNTTRQSYRPKSWPPIWLTVNELFLVEILGLPWPAYLAAQRAGTNPDHDRWLAGRYSRPA